MACLRSRAEVNESNDSHNSARVSAFLSGLERVIFQLQVHCIFFFTFSFFSVRASISLMVNDIAAVSPMNNLLVKYADAITISVPVRQSTDTAAAEVEYMKKWADINEMSLNFI